MNATRWKNRSWPLPAILGAILALIAAPVSAQDDGWTQVEIRGGLELVELIAPLFGEIGAVGAAPGLMFGVGWRQTDFAELVDDPEADGLKPLGIYVAGSFDVADPFGFNWIQLQGGITFEELVTAGIGVWVGNATETNVDDVTGEESTNRIPGLDLKLKTVLGLGIQGDPE